MDPRPYHYQYRKPRLSNPTYQSDHLYQSIYHVGSFGRMNHNLDKINNNYILPNNNQVRPKYSLPNGYQPKGNSNRESYIEQSKQNYQKYNNGNNNINNGGNRQAYRYDDRGSQNANLNNYQSSIYQNQSNLVRKSNQFVNQEQSHQNREAPLPRQSSQKKSIPPSRQYPSYHEPITHSNQPYQMPQQKRQQSQPRSYSQDDRTSNQKQQLDQGYMSNYGSRLMKPMPGRDQDFIYERQQKPYNIISCYPKDGPANTHRVYPRITLQNRLIQNGQYLFPDLVNNNGYNGHNPQRF